MSWLAVAVAAVVVGGVAGILLSWSAWTAPRGGSRLAVGLLSLDTGLVLVGGIVLAAAAVRSAQLVDRPAEALRSTDLLLQVSRLDGDGQMFALIVLFIGVLTLLLAAILGVAARSANSEDDSDRRLVETVLGIEVALGLYGLGRLVFGGHGAPLVVAALHLPLAAIALARASARARPAPRSAPV